MCRAGIPSTILAILASASLAFAADRTGDSMEQKRQEEIQGGSASGRPLEARPGKVMKASELPAELAKLPQMKPDDEIKQIHDDALNVDFYVNLTLARKWKEARGGDSVEWTGKVAPDIKPGVVITSQNYKQFKDLDQLLPPFVYEKLAAGAWDGIPEIRVGETDPIFPTRPYAEATRNQKYVGRDFTI